MYFSPILPKEIKGDLDQELLVLCEKVCIESASLKGSHNQQVINTIKELLRITNSYYSNMIESEGTHPIDIEKAMKRDFYEDDRKKRLQLLSLAHIETQRFIESYIQKNQSTNIYTKDFIKRIHQKFYTMESMDSFLEIKYNDKTFKMMPGEFRKQDVHVGKHIAPKHNTIEAMFNSFTNQYKDIYNSSTKATKLLYALSSHHRLLWIHPFLDGNGRISRLFLDAAFLNIDLDGYGLWNLSRGLARDTQNYKENLSFADMNRQDMTDGRGVLSLRGLKYYLKFMLETALDQISFMSNNLQLNKLGDRIDKFVMLSEQNMIDIAPLPKYSSMLFKELLIQGEIQRGKVKNIIGKKDRTASTLIKTLLEMDYLESDSPKGAIRLKFNTRFASYVFPELIPSR
jgi:Fic family protein